MKLLVVTDHRFHRVGASIVDSYCFDRAFFDDYRAVFDEVVVAARVRADPAQPGARRSDGKGVVFLGLPDLRGLSWITARIRGHLDVLRDAVREADAVVVRLPSVAGAAAADLARNACRPVMFELIGDPSASLSMLRHGLPAWIYGRRDAARVRRIIKQAWGGSYVSKRHLQSAYPARDKTMTASISSIRLPDDAILEPRPPRAMQGRLHVVLVASFVPIKRHDVLVRALAHPQGNGVSATLIGGGSMMAQTQALADSLGVADRIRFLGHVADRQRLEQELDTSDLFVMCSDSEGMPRAMLEAMARGVPAIGTRAGGIAELLPDDQLFPTGDWRALARLLQRIRDTPDVLTEWSARSIQAVGSFRASELSRARQALLTQFAEEARARSA